MPVRFSQSVLIQLADLEGVPLNNIGKMMASFSTWPAGRLYRMLYLALKDGARKEGIAFTIECVEDLIDMIEEDQTIMEQLIKIATETAPEKKPVAPEKKGRR